MNNSLNNIKQPAIKIEDLVEVELPLKDNFHKVKETLTRIGIASTAKKELYQSCHILQKAGRYYITHFKELFALDGRESTFTEEDRARRNTIANLLAECMLVKLVDPDKTKSPVAGLSKIKILSYKEKNEYTLKPKHRLGTKDRFFNKNQQQPAD